MWKLAVYSGGNQLSSFRSSDDINENENGSYRGFGYLLKPHQ